MNLTRTPTDSNIESLRKQFPHLEVKTGKATKQQKGKAADKAAAAKAKEGNTPAKNTPKAKAASKPEKGKAVSLTLPDVKAAPAKSSSLPTSAPPPAEPEKKTKRRATSPVESEEDDDDDDGGLTVEYPGGNPAAFQPTSHFSSSFPVAVTRRFSEFARDIEQGEEEDEDIGDDVAGRTDRGYGGYGDDEAGYEEEEEEEDEEEEEEEPQPRRPPVLAEPPVAVEPEVYTFDDGDDDGDADFGDLEADMEREFEQVQNEGHESDSSVSEEE